MTKPPFHAKPQVLSLKRDHAPTAFIIRLPQFGLLKMQVGSPPFDVAKRHVIDLIQYFDMEPTMLCHEHGQVFKKHF